MSRTFILHNNNFENLLTNWYKNNYPINIQVTYNFFYFKSRSSTQVWALVATVVPENRYCVSICLCIL